MVHKNHKAYEGWEEARGVGWGGVGGGGMELGEEEDHRPILDDSCIIYLLTRARTHRHTRTYTCAPPTPHTHTCTHARTHTYTRTHTHVITVNDSCIKTGSNETIRFRPSRSPSVLFDNKNPIPTPSRAGGGGGGGGEGRREGTEELLAHISSC